MILEDFLFLTSVSLFGGGSAPPARLWLLAGHRPRSVLADINLNSPNKGLLSDSMTDVPVDTAQTPVEGLTEAEAEELRAELAKVLCLAIRPG